MRNFEITWNLVGSNFIHYRSCWHYLQLFISQALLRTWLSFTFALIGKSIHSILYWRSSTRLFTICQQCFLLQRTNARQYTSNKRWSLRNTKHCRRELCPHEARINIWRNATKQRMILIQSSYKKKPGREIARLKKIQHKCLAYQSSIFKKYLAIKTYYLRVSLYVILFSMPVIQATLWKCAMLKL